jgi:hypothetical protein
VSIGIDPNVVFKDADWALMIGAKPRGPGQERADLLDMNGRIFVDQVGVGGGGGERGGVVGGDEMMGGPWGEGGGEQACSQGALGAPSVKQLGRGTCQSTVKR